jgi:hypothetical protein
LFNLAYSFACCPAHLRSHDLVFGDEPPNTATTPTLLHPRLLSFPLPTPFPAAYSFAYSFAYCHAHLSSHVLVAADKPLHNTLAPVRRRQQRKRHLHGMAKNSSAAESQKLVC